MSLFNHWKDEDDNEDVYNEIIGSDMKGRSVDELLHDIRRKLDSNDLSRIERSRLSDLENKLTNNF